MSNSNSELKSIQKKLMAAICMVLVASIMVVSSSYAWFTLSTAPEVTGITTSVGSNGNLEMALIDTDLDDITSTSSYVDFPDANNYWGNLVELQHEQYMLSSISLAPARLYAVSGTTETNAVGPTYLYTAVYGTDGRVSDMATNMLAGIYNTTEGAFTENETEFGVRAVGTASGLSAAEIALRDARAKVSSTKYSVRKAAINSLQSDAIGLAGIMVNEIVKGDGYVTAAEFAQVATAVANLRAIVDDLKETIDLTVKTVGVAQDITVTSIEYGTSAITAKDAEGNTVDFSKLTNLQSALLSAYDDYSTMNTDVGGAETSLNSASKSTADGHTDEYEYDVFEGVLTSILSTADMKIGETAIAGADMDKLMTIVINAYFGNNGTLDINIVDGIYYDIGRFVDDYNANAEMKVNIEGTSYSNQFGTLTKVPVNINMNIDATAPVGDYFYNDYFYAQLTTLNVEGGSSNATVISDLYAYAIDLAFRTNAANSNLMLQTDAASRVGEDSSDAVQGAGSYMEFTKGDDEGYTVERMKELMGAIRVVLMNWENQDIYAIAALDMGTAQVEDDTVTAYLYLYEYTIGDTGLLTLGDKAESAAITELTQNEAIGITALVYLDGDYVDNSSVAINGDSMTGSMNLQFSSDATLVPMDYTFADSSSSGDEETALDAPNLTLNGSTLSWDEVENATSYTVGYSNADQTVTGTLTATGTTIDLQTALDDAGVAAGTYTIAVAATADGYTAGTATKSYAYTPSTTTP